MAQNYPTSLTHTITHLTSICYIGSISAYMLHVRGPHTDKICLLFLPDIVRVYTHHVYCCDTTGNIIVDSCAFDDGAVIKEVDMAFLTDASKLEEIKKLPVAHGRRYILPLTLEGKVCHQDLVLPVLKIFGKTLFKHIVFRRKGLGAAYNATVPSPERLWKNFTQHIDSSSLAHYSSNIWCN